MALTSFFFFIGQRNGGSCFMEREEKVRGNKLPLMMPCALEYSTHTHTHTQSREHNSSVPGAGSSLSRTAGEGHV